MADVTPRGYPFPTSEDFVRDGAAAIEALARSLDPGVAIAGRRYTNTGQNVPNQTYTDLSLGTQWELSGGVTGAQGGIRVPEAGVYLIAGGVRWASNTTGYRRLSVLINGSSYQMDQQAAGGNTTVTLNTMALLAADDIITGQIYQSSGGTLATQGTQGFPYLAAALVGRYVPPVPAVVLDDVPPGVDTLTTPEEDIEQ